MKKILLSILIVSQFLFSCSTKEFVKNPVDEMIRDMNQEPQFSIILYDMDVQGSFVKSYYHKYQLVKIKNDEPVSEISDWTEVSRDYFLMHENDMGMEVAAKNADGKVTKNAAPPGYSSYVGNEKYGRWVQRDGSSFWEFYGKYAMLSSVFHMFSYPINRMHYNDYYGNFYGRGAYYGPTVNGRRTYGTYSDFNSKTRTNSRYTNSSSFKQRVQSKVQRSSSTASKSSRTSRTSNRYSSSSYRSRGGGSGK